VFGRCLEEVGEAHDAKDLGAKPHFDVADLGPVQNNPPSVHNQFTTFQSSNIHQHD